MKNYNQFISESLRDKMEGPSIDDALDSLLSKNNYNRFLKSALSYFFITDKRFNSYTQIYLFILEKIDFDIIKNNIDDVLNSFNKILAEYEIKKYSTIAKNLKNHEDLKSFIYKIDRDIGHIYRIEREMLRRLILKSVNLEEAKMIITKMIKGSI